jgi:hypothetical protein
MADTFKLSIDVAEAIKEMRDFSKATLAEVKKVSESTKKLEEDTKKAAKGMGKIADAAEGLFAVFLTSKLNDFFGGFISQAQESLSATKQLGFAFAAAGQDVDKGVANISAFADELQKTTSLSDEFVIGIAGQIQALKPLSTIHLKQATKAVLDFSAARGISAEAAAQAFAKGISGNTRSLLQYNIAVKKSSDETVQFDRVLAAFSANAGATDKTLGTFKGAVAQLGNAYGEVQENIGKAILKSPELISLINSLAKSFFALADSAQSGVVPALKGFLSVVAPLAQTILPVLPNLLSAAAGAAIAFTGALAVGKIAALVASLNPMVLAFTAIGASLAIIIKYLVQWYGAFGSVANLTKALGYAMSSVMLDLVEIIGRGVAKILEWASVIPGVGDSFASIAKVIREDLKDVAKRSDEAVTNIQKLGEKQTLKIDSEKAFAELEKGKEIQLKLKLEAIAAIESQIKSINDAVKNGNLTQRQIVEKEYKDRIATLNKAVALGADIEGGAAKLRLSINAKFQADMAKLDQDAADKRKQILESASKDVTSFINSFKKLKESGASSAEVIGAGAAAAIGSISKGAEGARQAVVGTLTAAATAAFGPIGQAAGPLFDLLSQGPEKVKETINAFIQQIPIVLENIVLAIPALIQAIVDNIPILIDRLTMMLPTLIDALIELLPELLVSLTLLMPKVSLAFTFALIKSLPKIIDALLFAVPQIVAEFTIALVNSAWDFVVAVYDAVKEIFPGLGSAQKAASGDFGGAISDTISGIGDFFGFAEGGMVPAGYPNDSFPAKLTSGEAILPTDTVAKLENFLNTGGGAGQNVTVNLVVGEEQLAKVILNLNRQGFRLN